MAAVLQIKCFLGTVSKHLCLAGATTCLWLPQWSKSFCHHARAALLELDLHATVYSHPVNHADAMGSQRWMEQTMTHLAPGILGGVVWER